MKFDSDTVFSMEFESVAKFYTEFPQEMVGAFAHLTRGELENYIRHENPTTDVHQTSEMEDAEASKKRSQAELGTISQERDDVTAAHHRALIQHRAEYEEKVTQSNEELDKKLQALDNRRIVTDMNMESHTSLAQKFLDLVKRTRKKATLAKLIRWSPKKLPYARDTLENIILDLELSTGEAAVRLLTRDQCLEKLHRLENLGYRHSKYWKQLRKSKEFCDRYPTDAIKTHKGDDHVSEIQDRLIDYLMLMGFDPSTTELSPKTAPAAGFVPGTYVGEQRHEERRKELRRKSIGKLSGVSDETSLDGLSLADILDELTHNPGVVAEAVRKASAKKRRRSTVANHAGLDSYVASNTTSPHETSVAEDFVESDEQPLTKRTKPNPKRG